MEQTNNAGFPQGVVMKRIAALAVALTLGALGCASNQNKKDTVPDQKDQVVDADAGPDQADPQDTGTDTDTEPKPDEPSPDVDDAEGGDESTDE